MWKKRKDAHILIIWMEFFLTQDTCFEKSLQYAVILITFIPNY